MEFVLIQKAKAEELDYDPSEGLELGRLRVILAVGVLATNVISVREQHKEGIE